jgi:hypothetical protein
MRAIEPACQVRRRQIRRLAIERHHCGRDAREPDERRAPTLFGYPCHFNDVTTAGNDVFESVPHDLRNL